MVSPGIEKGVNHTKKGMNCSSKRVTAYIHPDGYNL